MKRLAKWAAIIAAVILLEPELIRVKELAIYFRGYMSTLAVANGWSFWLGHLDWLSNIFREIIECVKIAWSVFWKDGAIETVAKGASYSVVDNLTTAISPATVAFLKIFDWTDLSIAMVMWAEDIVIAYGTMRFSQSVIEDFTLSKALRASVESIRERSLIGEIISWIWKICLLARFSLWDGPERVAIFFHRELKTHAQELLVIIIFAAVQAIFWTKMYSLGIDGLVDIWKLFF